MPAVEQKYAHLPAFTASLNALPGLNFTVFAAAIRISSPVEGVNVLTPLASEIKLAFVYGSVAQNRDHAGNDIDLMIISGTLTYGQIMAALQPAENALARPIQVTQYAAKELLERKQQKHHFIAEVLDHPKLMIMGTEDDIDRIR